MVVSAKLPVKNWAQFRQKGQLTVTKRSRSRDGRLDGAKCSFRNTHCLMMFSLSRLASTRDSADPDIVCADEALMGVNIKCKMNGRWGERTSQTSLVPATSAIAASRTHRQRINDFPDRSFRPLPRRVVLGPGEQDTLFPEPLKILSLTRLNRHSQWEEPARSCIVTHHPVCYTLSRAPQWMIPRLDLQFRARLGLAPGMIERLGRGSCCTSGRPGWSARAR